MCAVESRLSTKRNLIFLSDLQVKAVIVQSGTDCPVISAARKQSIPDLN
jgi:hypothetical protein